MSSLERCPIFRLSFIMVFTAFSGTYMFQPLPSLNTPIPSFCRPFDSNFYEDEVDEDEVLDEEGRARLKLKVCSAET